MHGEDPSLPDTESAQYTKYSIQFLALTQLKMSEVSDIKESFTSKNYRQIKINVSELKQFSSTKL